MRSRKQGSETAGQRCATTRGFWPRSKTATGSRPRWSPLSGVSKAAYGSFRGDTPIIEALATLAFDGRRGKFFEEQLIAALKIIQSGDVRPEQMTGSWAGAMGHTHSGRATPSSSPTSYLAYAQDFPWRRQARHLVGRPDGRPRVHSRLSRALRLDEGPAMGRRSGAAPGLRLFSDRRAGEEVSPSQWAAMGVRDTSGGRVPNHGRASILLPAARARGAAFMIFDNFHVIERYNTADAYVIGVGHLSDRIAGGPPIRANWPRGDRGLRAAERRQMQELLTRRGHDTQGVDGHHRAEHDPGNSEFPALGRHGSRRLRILRDPSAGCGRRRR